MKVEDFDMFSTLLKQRSGLVLSRDKAYLLELRLMPVARKWNMKGLDELAVAIRTRREEALLRDITEAMTTNESSFFRDQKPFEQFKQVVLPRMLANRSARRSIRIWSAACSSGQEAYSLCMLLLEEGAKLDGWRFEIVGTDLSSEMVEKSKAGIYTQFEVQRGLPITHLVKYFRQVGDKWQVSDKIRQMVNFREYNLLTDLTPLGQFDVVFCRNVLIYFDQPTKGKVLDSIAKLMPADGVLYLGGAETVLGITERFKPMENQRGLYVVNPPGGAGSRQSRGGLKLKLLGHGPTLNSSIHKKAGGRNPCRRLFRHERKRAAGSASACGLHLLRRHRVFLGIAQHIAPAPDGLDVVVALGGLRQLLAQLADEDVDDLQFRLVHAAVEMVQEHLLGQRGALAQAQQFKNAVFLARQVQRRIVDFDRAGIQVDRQTAGPDHAVGMAFAAADDGLDARDQLALVEGLGQIIVGADAQSLDLVVQLRQAGQDQDRRGDAGGTETAQNLIAVDVRQHQVQNDYVVVIQLSDLQPILTEIGGIDDEALGVQHQFNTFCDRGVVFDQQNPHGDIPTLMGQDHNLPNQMILMLTDDSA